MGDKHGLADALKQADKLNSADFGLYFALCLRKEKKGSADSAAWVPALWIDIDSTDSCDLEKLKAFEPARGFIISSGGGWHGYWLLNEPFLLETDADKQKLATILRGLFTALGGDPGYVKSVASVMRLPDSVNTKPERGGVVAIIENDSDRRYSLREFTWLESNANEERIGDMHVVTLNGNGHHPLPPCTEQYLASGASNGNRNHELFAAACQMRDAGYSQGDAERELIARHMADGNGNENPASREKEARATIASAYRQPPRDPIAAPRQQARERVAQLVGSYTPDQRRERPTAEQIAEVVQACAHLNAVEWSEERQRLKAICGDGLRLVDLDRVYREARRKLERQSLPSEDRYLIVDGCILYEKVTERGVNRQRIADWTAQVVERTSRIDDDGQVEHLVRLELSRGEKTQPLIVPSELFGDANALQRHIARQAGERFTARTGMNKHLPTALLSLSGDYPTRTTYRFMGWAQIDEIWAYVTPSLTVGAEGVHEQAPEVELETRLRDYGLHEADWTQSLAAFVALRDALPSDIAPALIAYAVLPLVQRFFPAAAPKPAMHLQGTTGTGKSEIASLLCSFYGKFTRDMPPS